MVMPPITDGKTLAASGAKTEDGRRPTLVSAPDAASPELVLRLVAAASRPRTNCASLTKRIVRPAFWRGRGDRAS